MLAYQAEFTDKQGDAFGSALYWVSKQTQFDFYHYKAGADNTIHNTENLDKIDPRFALYHKDSPLGFASDAKLFRGCVRLSKQ